MTKQGLRRGDGHESLSTTSVDIVDVNALLTADLFVENPSRIRNSSLLARIDAKADLFEDFLFEVEEKGVWTWSEG